MYPIHVNAVIQLGSAWRKYNKKCGYRLNHTVIIWIIGEPDPVLHIGIQPKFWRYEVLYFLYPVAPQYRKYHLSYKTTIEKVSLAMSFKKNGFQHLGYVDCNEDNKNKWREFYTMSGYYKDYGQ
jgi:hypothetical protein